MTLTINSSWMEAASRDTVSPVFLLALTDGTTTWKAQSAEHDTMKHGVGVLSVGELAPEIDVMTRRLEVGEVELVVSDAWLRPILVSNRLFGKKATLKLGFYGVTEANFVNYHVGLIDSIIPDGSGKTARLSLMSALELARRQLIVGYWIGEHPLDVIYNILNVKLGVHADLIDATSLDPDTYTGISHFVVSRVNQSGITRAVTEPTSAFDLIDELAQLCNGTLYVDEDGKVSFRIFDSTAAEAATWTTAEIVSLEQTALDEYMANRCEVTMSHGLKFAQEDATSILALAYPGTSARRVVHEIESDWFMGGGAFTTIGVAIGISAAETASIAIHGSSFGNFLQACCGSRESYPSASQPANAKISAARPLYLMTNTGEIIKATGMTAFGGDAYNAPVYTQDPDTGANVVDGPHIEYWQLSGVTRGALGTAAAAASSFGDITMAVYLATAIVDRHAYGLAVLDVTTKLSQYDKEPGDLLKIVWPPFLDYNRDGVVAGDGKFEIVSKEVDAAAGQISWTLAWAGVNTPSYTYAAAPNRIPGSLTNQAFQMAEGEYSVLRHIASGFGVEHSAGLDVTIKAGRAASGAITTALGSDHTITLTANTDNYIVLDLSGKLVVYGVGRGEASPALSSNQIRIAKVLTSASAAYSIDTSMAPTKPVDGAKLVASSVDSAQLANLAVTTGKLANEAVAAEKIGKSAVTTSKIANAAIGPVHQTTNSKKKGMFANSQFSIAKKG